MSKLQLERFEISHELWNAEPENTRYAVLLLGHIFNEVMTLQKLSIVSIPHPTDPDTPEKLGRVVRVLFLSRMLSGKLYEAQNKINSREIHEFLSTRCYPHMPDGKGEKLKREFNKMANDCKWLATARNGHAMHYPSFNDFRCAMEQMKASNAGYEFLRDGVAGNYLYVTSAEAAAQAFYMESGEQWDEAVRTMTNTINALSGTLVEFIVESLNAYLGHLYGEHKEAQAKIENTAPFDVPPIRGFNLPFFYTDRRRTPLITGNIDRRNRRFNDREGRDFTPVRKPISLLQPHVTRVVVQREQELVVAREKVRKAQGVAR